MRKVALLLVAAATMTAVAFWLWPRTGALTPQACALGEDTLGGFIDIPGGGFIKGADPHYPEEGRPQKVFVSPFRLQIHEVTNSQFAAFVAATGYVTEAERIGRRPKAQGPI